MDQITYDDFMKVDIRMGTVVTAEVPDWSHWVLRMAIDLGEEIGTKKCFSGIMKFFTPEQLIGKQFPFVVNLKPRTIGPDKELSEVMMIMATPTASQLGGQAVPDEEVPTVLFQLQDKVENGCKVR